jgi:hypothetical protein
MQNKSIRRFQSVLSWSLAALFAWWASASRAEVILNYVGPTFDAFYPSGNPPESYTTSNQVTATLVLADALGANLQAAYVTPLSYSFSDGLNSVSSANLLSYFYFSTNASGAVTYWGAEIDTDVGNTELSMFTIYNNRTNQLSDAGIDRFCSAPAASYTCGNNSIGVAWGQYSAVVSPLPAGTGWSMQTVPVPEPGTPLLLAAGLAVLAARRVRRNSGVARMDRPGQ